MQRLRVAFVVQGEGRGHMTQALALASMLREAGHEVARVMIGRSPHRPLPSYFTAGIDAPISEFDAPVQVSGSDGQSMSVRRTLADALRRSPRFVRSVVAIADGIRESEADVVVNLLDLMGGVSMRLFPPPTPSVAIAHNYLFLHPELDGGAPGPAHSRRAVLGYARATAAGSDRVVGLSFRPLEGRRSSRLSVAPPLLRAGIESLEPRDEGYLLAYALNPGYGRELLAWQKRSGAPVHCFVEGGSSAVPGGSPGFHAHDLDATAFLQRLAGCRAYVGTAGFESLCEAYFLGKPILAVPTEGQFEQTLNAWDAARCDIARAGSYSDLDDFWSEPEAPSVEAVSAFRAWVARAPEVLVDVVERCAHLHHTGDDS